MELFVYNLTTDRILEGRRIFHYCTYRFRYKTMDMFKLHKSLQNLKGIEWYHRTLAQLIFHQDDYRKPLLYPLSLLLSMIPAHYIWRHNIWLVVQYFFPLILFSWDLNNQSIYFHRRISIQSSIRNEWGYNRDLYSHRNSKNFEDMECKNCMVHLCYILIFRDIENHKPLF